jgi:hypothetical protein
MKKPYTMKKGLTMVFLHAKPRASTKEPDMPTQAELARLRVQKEAPKGIPNIHPADELAAVREEIKILETQADALRDRLLAEGADLHGDQYTANIIPGTRETLDRKAITEAFGEAAVAPFLKKTVYQTVKLVEND